MMLGNPVYRLRATPDHPIHLCRGDCVEHGGEWLEAMEGGTFWPGGGTAKLKPASAEALAYVPPHNRLINRALGFLGLLLK